MARLGKAARLLRHPIVDFWVRGIPSNDVLMRPEGH